MNLRFLSGVLGGVSLLLVASSSRAQCTKDTDCKGDRVCEEGACMAPNALLPPPAPAPAATPPAALPVPPPSATPNGSAAVGTIDPRQAEAPPSKPKMQRHSTGMMVSGIVMTSLAPFALLVALVVDLEQTSCEGGFLGERAQYGDDDYRDCSTYDNTIYGGLLVGGGLLAAGIPMIVIGGKKEPVPAATVRGWVTASGGGLGLRVDL